MGGVRVELLVLEDSLQGNGFGALGGGLKPERVVLGPLHFVELVAILLARFQADLLALFVPDEVGLAVDDFKLVFSLSDFLDDPELSEVIVVRGCADDGGLIVIVGVVGLDLQGLVSILADDLVEVSFGEHSLHRIFPTFINIQNTDPN